MKHLYIIGPAISLKGGISTVIKQIINSDAINEQFIIKDIATINKNKIISFITSIYKSIRIDLNSISHVHMASNGSFVRKSIIISVLGKRSKVIIHIHGGYFGEFYSNSNSLIKKVIRKTLNKAQTIICVSESMRNDILRIIPEHKSIKVVYNSIKDNNKEINFNTKENIMVYMGKLIEYKGIYDFLRCLRDIKADINSLNWKVQIAGNGEYEKVKKLVEEYDLNDIVELLGWIDGDEKEKVLRRGKIFIMPSYIESFGIACVEAMSYGEAIICSNVGGLTEIVSDGENGRIVNAGDEYELKNTIIKMINNPESILSYGKANINKAKYFSEFEMINNIVRIYDSID